MSVNIKGENNESHPSELHDGNNEGHNFNNDDIPEPQSQSNQQAHDDQVDINMDEIDKVISESITHGNEQAEYQQSYIDSNDSSKRELDEPADSNAEDNTKRQRIDEYGANSSKDNYTNNASGEEENKQVVLGMKPGQMRVMKFRNKDLMAQTVQKHNSKKKKVRI